MSHLNAFDQEQKAPAQTRTLVSANGLPVFPYPYGPLLAVITILDGVFANALLYLPGEAKDALAVALDEWRVAGQCADDRAEVLVYMCEATHDDGNVILWRNGEYTPAMQAAFIELGMNQAPDLDDDLWKVLQIAGRIHSPVLGTIG